MPDHRETQEALPAGWTQRYLALLNVEHDAPSFEALTNLVRAHALTVPFENVTALMRRRAHPEGPVPPPDPATLLDSWERRAGGGVCFEIVDMLARLLRELGYHTQVVLAEISLPNGHQAVVVEFAGRRYLIDVGNGAPFFEPIPLSGPFEVHRHGLSFRFRQGDDDHQWIQDRLIDSEWKAFARYTMRPAIEADREAGYQHHHTPGASWVMGTLTMIRSTEDAVYALRDATLTRHTDAGKTAETLADPASYRRTADDDYGLPNLPIEDALALRAEFDALGNSTLTR